MDDQTLSRLAEGPLSPPAEERAVLRLDAALRREYERLFDTCDVRSERVPVADGIVDRVVAARARYAGLETSLGTPWFVPAVIHSLEAGQRFDRHLHNGDPLTGRTVHVPAGRPARGRPPFTWEASAQDALELKGLHRWDDWSPAGVLFKLEEYNGWGYRQFHQDVLSPYLWSFSNHYTRGKYVADGRFDASAVSQQCGAAVLIRRMVDRALIEFSETGPGEPLLRYSGANVLPRGVDLQRFLNTLPGSELEVDGKLGPASSDAFRRAFGYRLRGDPR